MKPPCRALAFAALLLVAACAPTRVTPIVAATTPLSPPQLVVVQDLSLPPDGATLDRGIGARFARAVGKDPEQDRQIAAAIAAREAFSRALVGRLRDGGIAAMRADGAPRVTTALIVSGQFLALDEGNRTRRTLVGFGAGASDAEAQVTISLAGAETPPQFVGAFAVDARSGRKPGAAGTMGLGAAAGRLAESAAVTGAATVASEALGAGIDADAERMAKAVADEIFAIFAAQGWRR